MSTAITALSGLNLAGEAARFAQLQLAGQTTLPPNTTITASYSFAVNEDGQLTPTAAQLVTQTSSSSTTENISNSTQNSGKPITYTRQNSTSLSDISNPKAQLSPSDEAEIFSSIQTKIQNEPQELQSERSQGILHAFTANKDESENSSDTESADSNSSNNGSQDNSNVLSLNDKLQQRAASLYARNADIVYNVEPIVYQAA